MRSAERLIEVVQELSQARSVDAVVKIVRVAARELTGADGATFVLRDGDECHYVEENAIAPLWKGRRFPMTACISGWAMLNGRSAVIEDIYADDRIPADAYRPTFVKSLVMVPVRRRAPIAAIGNYWAKRRKPGAAEVEVLQALADSTSVALENADLIAQLQAQVDVLCEREGRIAEQRDALEVFTRSLAHDLREPVRAVRCFARLLADPDVEVDVNELVRRIGEAGERMAMLIDTVFQYTQLDDPAAFAKEEFNLGEAVSAAVASLRPAIAEREATIDWEPLPPVVADRWRMTQLFRNLIANAMDHSKAPVRVTIGAERLDGELKVRVRDDGPGVRPQDRERIFEPFRRMTHDKSHAGLGLAICRKVVALHGGRIGCEAGVDRGASFFFTLPRGAKPGARSPAAVLQMEAAQ